MRPGTRVPGHGCENHMAGGEPFCPTARQHRSPLLAGDLMSDHFRARLGPDEQKRPPYPVAAKWQSRSRYMCELKRVGELRPQPPRRPLDNLAFSWKLQAWVRGRE